MTGTAALGFAFALAALAMFSINIVLTKLAMARLALGVGFLIAVIVNVLFGALVVVVQLVLRDEPLQFEAYAFVMFLLSGAFTTYLGRWFFFEAVARLGAARASTFQVSSPLFTAIIAWIALGERISVPVALAMLVVVYGLYLVGVKPGAWRAGARAVPDASRSRTARLRVALGSGAVLGAGSSLAYAVGNVLRGAAIHRWNEPALGALVGAIMGVALHMTLSRETRDLRRALRAADRVGILLYASCGVLTISAQMLTIAAMSSIPVSIAALITLCSPLIVFPLSYMLFRADERITPRLLAGSALALAGIAVIVLR